MLSKMFVGTKNGERWNEFMRKGNRRGEARQRRVRMTDRTTATSAFLPE